MMLLYLKQQLTVEDILRIFAITGQYLDFETDASGEYTYGASGYPQFNT